MPRFILFAALLAMTQNALAVDQEKILSALKTVVMIRGYNDTGGLSYGSGVVVADNKVISNCHILRSTKQPWVARGEDTYETVSVQADRWHDLCLLTTTNLPFKPAHINSSYKIKRGEDVISIGHSNGSPAPLTSAGTVKSTYTFEGGQVIRSNAQFRMGASGSGIFDGDGNLLGINTFKTPGRNAYFYSLPIEWLADIQKLPVETVFPIKGKAFWEEDDNKKPFFMQVALPEINQDWAVLAKIAQQWINAEPTSTDAWFELANAQENMNQLEEAKVAYQKSAALDATNTDALFRLGAIAKASGDKSTAQQVNIKLESMNKDVAKEYREMLGCDAQC